VRAVHCFARGYGRSAVTDDSHHSHDLELDLRLPEPANACADHRAVRIEPARERLVDDDDAWTRCDIRIGERASGQERRTM
jgi:hypothetical protein